MNTMTHSNFLLAVRSVAIDSQMRINTLKLKLILFSVLFFLGCLRANAQNSLTQSFNGVKELKLALTLGNCKITRSSTQEVRVVVEHTFKNTLLEPQLEQKGNLLLIKEIVKQGRLDGEVTWTLAVPDNVSIVFNTGSGDFEAEAISTSMHITTGSGDISVSNLTLTGSGRFTSGSGNVNITVAASPKFDLELTSGSGDARLDFNHHQIEGKVIMATTEKGKVYAPFGFDTIEKAETTDTSLPMVVRTIVKGSPANRISISTGTGEAIIKE
jgi:DUF4097 and DUF4098 domain-containing protein YvlB